MELIKVDGTGEISYEILRKYHFSAQGIYDIRIEKPQALEEEYPFSLNIPAESIEEASQICLNYFDKLNELGIFYHIGHLVYITQNLIRFEGNFINDQSPLHNILLGEINLLMKFVNIYESAKNGKLVLEITHKSDGKEFDDYIKIKDAVLIEEASLASAKALISSIKTNSHLSPHSVQELIANLDTLEIQKLKEIRSDLILTTEQAFKSQFLYTVCITMRDYLKAESPLTHPTANLTNDQARVIYETCKIHGLITLPHEMDIEKINYIRAVLSNKTNSETMNGVIVDA